MNEKTSIIRLSVLIQVLVIMLVVELVFAWLLNRDNSSTIAISKVLICVITFFISKYINHSFGKKAINSVIAILIIWLTYESLLGLLQIYGLADSNHSIYRLTGSFQNPNPYAGFLVVLSSIIFANYKNNSVENKFLKWGYFIPLFLVLIILPASKCRSAFCALIVAVVIYWGKDKFFRRMLKKHYLLFLLIIITLAGAMYIWKRPSADWRLFQNKISLISIRNNGLFGGGLGHYCDNVSKTQMIYFHDALSLEDGNIIIPESLKNECRIAGRCQDAFCDFLQIGVEAGVVTMITFMVLVLLSLIYLYKAGNPFFYGLVSMMVICLFSYPLSLWQNELLFSWIIGMTCSEMTNKKTGLLCDVFLFPISVILLLYCAPVINSIKRDNRKWIIDCAFYKTEDYSLYCDYCKDKVGTLNNNEVFMLQYGIALAEINNIELSDSVLSLGFDMCGNPAFLILLGDNCMKKNDYEMAEEYYWKSFCCIPDRVFPLSCLANLYKSQNMSDKLENIKLFVENFKPRVETGYTDYFKERTINMTE